LLARGQERFQLSQHRGNVYGFDLAARYDQHHRLGDAAAKVKARRSGHADGFLFVCLPAPRSQPGLLAMDAASMRSQRNGQVIWALTTHSHHARWYFEFGGLVKLAGKVACPADKLPRGEMRLRA